MNSFTIPQLLKQSLKKVGIFFFLLHLSQSILAQDFSGYRAGNYTGVNGVFFNPANIADSRYRWDFNLFSLNTGVGNNQASFNLKNISETFNGDSLINKFIGKDAGTSSGNVNATIHGPSVLFNTGKKAAFAFTSRARVMMNAVDIEGKLVDKILNDLANDPELPYTVNSSENMRVLVNGWSEFGVSYARILKEEGKHFLKGGLSLKYLAGVANGYMQLNGLKATINEDPINFDPYFSNTTGRLQLALGGIDIADFDLSKLTSFKSTGVGADIGFVYEYRPDVEKYHRNDSGWRHDLNKYKLRIGIALLDIGSNKYTRDVQRSGAYDINITGSERLYTTQFEGLEIDSLKNFFDKNSQYFSPAPGNNDASYKVGLPTTLQIDADYHFHRGFYMSLAGQLSLLSTSNKPYNSQYYSALSLTPRYEGRGFGLYVPLSYNQLTSFNAGVSLRMGPFFIGSGSVLTALMGNSKQADVHLGLRFGSLQKNKEKKQTKQERKATKESVQPELVTPANDRR